MPDDSFWAGVGQVNGWPVAQAAIAYTIAGLPVLPLWNVGPHPEGTRCTCPKGQQGECDEPGKHPRVTWAEVAADVEQTRRWWGKWPDAGIGLLTGARSGLLVVDLDTRETNDPGTGEVVFWDGAQQLDAWAQEVLPEGSGGISAGLVARTGGGGQHLFWQDPGGVRNTAGWLPCVDVRGDGGMVVLSPTVHISGSLYQWEQSGSPLVPVPGLAAALQTAKGGRTPGGAPQVGAQASDDERAEYRLAKERGPRAGSRDPFFNAYAFELRRAGVERIEAEVRMRTCWEMAEQPLGDVFSWDAALRKLERAWVEQEPDPEHGIAWRPEPARPVLTVVRDGDEPPPPRGEPPRRAAGDPSTSLSDYGAALRFAHVNSPWHRYTPGQGWRAWDGVFWRPDWDGARVLADGWARFLPVEDQWLLTEPGAGDEDEQRRRARHRDNLLNANVQRRVLALAQAQASMRVDTADEWNPDPWLLTVKSGTIELRTQTWRASRPDDLCTMQAEVDYVPGATCPLWERHVQMICAHEDGSRDPDMEDYLQRWAGLWLTGVVDWQQFLLLWGRANNGKSKFVEGWLYMLGVQDSGYGAIGQPKLVTAAGQNAHPAMWADLAGKRLVFIDELPDKPLAEEVIKKITGEAMIRADKKHKDAFSFRAQFKTVFAANNLPPVRDSSDAFWRRVRPVPCLHMIAEEQRLINFLDLLVPERPGMLAWGLEGVRRLIAVGLGEGTVPERVGLAGAEYREAEDQLGSFLDETFQPGEVRDLKPDQLGWYPNPILWQLYRRWCETGGERPEFGKGGFLSRVSQRGWVRDQKNRRVTSSLIGSGQSKGLVGPKMISEVFGIEWEPRAPRGVGEE